MNQVPLAIMAVGFGYLAVQACYIRDEKVRYRLLAWFFFCMSSWSAGIVLFAARI